jgi:hypothetical protein
MRFGSDRAPGFYEEITIMGKTILLFIMSTLIGTLAGCAGNRSLIESMGAGTGQGIFREIDENASPAPGYVDLRIHSSLKMHKPGIYSRRDAHGTADYTLLVNIDGQATILKGVLNEEGSEALPMGDPEEGEGIRYLFTKRLRLRAGSHRVAVALPVDDIVAERELILSEGEVSSLAIEPVYGTVPGKQRPGTFGRKSFREGIKSIRLQLNGKSI